MPPTTKSPLSLLARSYLGADRFARRALRALDAVHKGVWLGLLDRAQLESVTQAMYRPSRSYREDAWNLSGFMYWEAAMVDRHFGGVRRALVLAAGGGREVVALCRRGVRVEGFDPDHEFVAAGKHLIAQEGLDARLRVSPPSEVPGAEGPFDGAIVGWNAYTHVPGREAREAFLRGITACLKPGSPILLSFFARAEKDPALELCYRVARFGRLFRPGGRVVQRGDTLMTGFFHYFDEDDLRAETGAAGLELVEFERHPQGHALARVPSEVAVE